MQRKNAAYCREVASRLHASLGMPDDDGRALASLLVNGGSATLSDVAAITDTPLGRAESDCESLERRGAI